MWASASKLIDSAVFLALFTAALYCIGLAEYSGFLQYYGLSVSVLDLDAYQLLYRGFLTSCVGILYFFLGLSVAYFLYAHIVLDFFIGWIGKSYKNRRKVVKFRIKLNKQRKIHPALIAKRKESNRLGMVFLLLFLFVIILACFEQKGVAKANKYLAALKAHGKQDEYIKIDLNGNEMTLAFLACGSRNCAALDMKTNRIHYFPQGIFSFPLPEQKKSK